MSGRWLAAAAVAAVAAGACAGRGTAAGTGSDPGSGSGSGSDPGSGSASGSGSATGAGFVRVPDSTTQLLVGVTEGWDATAATLRLWRRTDAHRWQPAGEPWPAVVGRAGLAWGRGVHGDGPPAGHPGPTKHEGDGTSPAGVFALGPSYGYDAAPPAGTRLPYTMATESWRCVDDPSSRYYTRLLDERTVTIDWSSREELRRDDEVYRWIIDVEHNADARPGAGSCIFLHVWSGPASTTSGCTAMDAGALTALLARLDPGAHPLFVLLPRDEYAALADAWDLPP